MDNSAAIAFDKHVKDRVDEQTRSIMSVVERQTRHLAAMCLQMPEHFSFAQSGDIRAVHSNYLRAILASTVAKHVSLSFSLARAAHLLSKRVEEIKEAPLRKVVARKFLNNTPTEQAKIHCNFEQTSGNAFYSGRGPIVFGGPTSTPDTVKVIVEVYCPNAIRPRHKGWEKPVD